ncbi:MAG: DUF4143 domain-containing protein [Candidatus Margulisbacteria bacterium]|nr:DUF4143 domain-containing protein [Candidatus Margulisiibacteriota bacterium]
MGELPNAQFILTGSSARKLKRAGVNLLGGRAITLHLHPLTTEEIGESADLNERLCSGALPSVMLEKQKEMRALILRSYVETYLKEEIQQEAITRNIPAFAHFLDLAGHENGNILNFLNISREVGVHSRTIKEYFAILEDTLIGFRLYPYVKSHRERLIRHPKFYFFDTGVVTALKGGLSAGMVPGTDSFGRAFEHFIILEVKRLFDYRGREAKISFFRTSDGAEVDLIIEYAENIWAIEIKASSAPRLSDIRGLRSFIKDHKCQRSICVCLTPRLYKEGDIEFIPWQEFLRQL